MFAYLSKKISVPNQTKTHSLSWNPDKGWIACGGESGLLKVLKLDAAADKNAPKARGRSSSSSLSMNQTLDGHCGNVLRCVWNAKYDKLATSDETGMIIVWAMHKGVFIEEMINNRNLSVVRDMQWSPGDGKKICIIYEDGHVIVGSVEGARLWGKELGCSLQLVSWSPSGDFILFVTSTGNVEVFDNHGNAVKSMLLGGNSKDSNDTNNRNGDEGAPSIVSLDWYDGLNGTLDMDAPTLAIAFSNGSIQFRRGIEDYGSTTIETDLSVSTCSWCPNGSTCAISGVQRKENQSVNMVQFFNSCGQHLRNMKLPGNKGVSALSWESSGQRLALAIDGSIYFANIRPFYKYCFVSSTIVYAFCKANKSKAGIMFWNTKRDERHLKYVRNIQHIISSGDYCLLVEKSHCSTHKVQNIPRTSIMTLCDSIGCTLEKKAVPLEPLYVSMSHTHIVLADCKYVYVWQYLSMPSPGKKPGVTTSVFYSRRFGKERVFDVNDRSKHPAKTLDSFTAEVGACKDATCALVISSKYAFVARETGLIQIYSLANLSLNFVGYFQGPRCPLQLHFNTDSNKIAVIDHNAVLAIFDISSVKDRPSKQSHEIKVGTPLVERRDTWDFKWNEEILVTSKSFGAFCTIEKAKLRLFQSIELPPDDPIISSSCILQFRDLEVTAFALDKIMKSPEMPHKDALQTYKTKRLLDAEEAIKSSTPDEALSYVQSNPHPRLWRTLGQHFLECYQFSMAERAFIEVEDYRSMSFAKRMSGLEDKVRQKADVAAFYGRHDEAEGIYLKIDRGDLAVELRAELGDWPRVAELAQQGGGNDEMLRKAWGKFGDQCADRFQWSKAAEYYLRAKDTEKAILAFYREGNFAEMEKTIDEISDGSEVLNGLANMFESVGMHVEAVQCFQKLGNIKSAIDSCVRLNQWEYAVRLSKEAGFGQIDGLIVKRASDFISRGDKFSAIELYRRADKPKEAAALLAEMAQDVAAKGANPLLAKKFHVLAAIEVERYRETTLDVTLTTGKSMATTMATLDTMMSADAESRGEGLSGKVLDNAWRGAAAYHYLFLAHRQLDYPKRAMLTAIRCAEYDDILDLKVVYSLLALVSFQSKFYGVCSKAFTRLEHLPNLDEESVNSIQNLALQIFTNYPPEDDQPLPRCYTACLETGSRYDACVSTGRSVLNQRTIQCKNCHHYIIEHEAGELESCPLCHSKLVLDDAIITIVEEENDYT